MKIAYVSSWILTMNDTFVVREIMEMANAGNDISVFVLTNKKSINSGNVATGINSKNVSIKVFQLNPIIILVNLAKIFFIAPFSFFKCFFEMLKASFFQPLKAHHFLYIFIASAFFARESLRQKVVYVHSHFLHSNAVAARWISMFAGIPYGVTVHIAKVRYTEKIIKKVVDGSSICICDTNEALLFLKSKYNKEGILIRNGIDLTSFEYKEPTDLKKKPIINILACGTLIPPKGFDVLVEACKLLKRDGIGFKCKIVGEGEERLKLEKSGEDLIREGFLELPGVMTIEALREEYKNADIFVMPSIPSDWGRDGLPTVLIEAMAFGIPVVGTNHAAIPELVEDGKTGLLVEPLDPFSLYNAIKKYIENFPLCQEVSKNCCQLIKEKYNVIKSVESLVRLIELAV